MLDEHKTKRLESHLLGFSTKSELNLKVLDGFKLGWSLGGLGLRHSWIRAWRMAKAVLFLSSLAGHVLSWGGANSERLYRIGTHCFELVLIVSVMIVSAIMGVHGQEIIVHGLFAIATMSLVHCADCCRTANERFESVSELTKYLVRLGRFDLAEKYDDLNAGGSLGCKLYRAATFITQASWFVCALFFAKVMENPKVEQNLFPMGFFTTLCFLLAASKVWAVSRVPDELGLSGLALAMLRSEGGDPGELDEVGERRKPR